jgi:hypothetical protein
MEGFNLIFKLNLQIQVNEFLVWISNSSPWIELVTRYKQKSLVQVTPKLKYQDEILSNSSQIQTLEHSLIFNSNYIPNFEKF